VHASLRRNVVYHKGRIFIITQNAVAETMREVYANASMAMATANTTGRFVGEAALEET